MKLTPSAKISNKNFKEMLAGTKGFVPTNLRKKLKEAGLDHLLFEKKINKEQALRAVKILQNRGLLGKNQAPSQLWHHAALKQHQQDQETLDEKIKKNVNIQIMMEISDELEKNEGLRKNYKYDPVRRLNKRVIDDIDEKNQTRQEKVEAEKMARQKLLDPRKKIEQKPTLMDLKNITNLDIG
jgi:hypothetical protein